MRQTFYRNDYMRFKIGMKWIIKNKTFSGKNNK